MDIQKVARDESIAYVVLLAQAQAKDPSLTPAAFRAQLRASAVAGADEADA